MKPEWPLCYSQVPRTGPYPEASESSPHTPYFFFHFNIILQSKLGGWFVDGYVERIWRKAVMSHFKILYQHLPEGAEEKLNIWSQESLCTIRDWNRDFLLP
jgi:hypothetical protein